MPVTKKPSINTDAFIDGAKADNAKTGKQENVKKDSSKTVKTLKSDNVKPLKQNKVKTTDKKRMTIYLAPELYLQWKGYELKQLQDGKKVSFQGVVEKYITKLVK